MWWPYNSVKLETSRRIILEITIHKRTIQCPGPNPYLQINVSSENSPLSDDEYVNVTVSGVFHPSDGDWVAMISPSDSKAYSVQCMADKILNA
ncbi:hypothetical protein NC651_038638 [Populus alba x Populus x berolinensis]|nr:hypothetical protein NC651_038638 [Populus alba x Populus x berolinensis]